MAIYHFSAQVISRSFGRSAVAAAAYRSGERLQDERYGRIYDYTKKKVAERAVVLPVHAPAWMKNREKLWNTVEQTEKRKDAQLCREINLAIPRELNPTQQRELLSHFVQRQFVSLGMIADVCIHRDNPENPHAHIMLTMREVSSNGFGKKVREWNDKDLLETWREAWATYANRALEDARINERIDHRSFKDQGKETQPTIHEGPHVRALEKRGIKTRRGNINRAVREYNQTIVSLQAYRQMKNELLDSIRHEQVADRLEQLQAKHSELVDQLNKKGRQIDRLIQQLDQVEKMTELEKQRQAHLKRIQSLEPKSMWDKLRNANKNEIKDLERKVESIEQTLTSITIPPAHELRAMNEEVSVLSGQYNALKTVLQELDTDIKQLNKQKIQWELLHERTLLDMASSSVMNAAVNRISEIDYEKERMARRNAHTLKRRKSQGYER